MNAKPLLAALTLVGCQAGQTSGPPQSLAKTTERRQVNADVTPLQMIAVDPAGPKEVAPPFSLTASDGSGLALTRIDAKAVVQGPLAFTELHLYFHNPENRTREGTFAITLPAGAAVSRFAMEINGQLQEAEVIEKATARRVYDDFLHRKQDPALLEKAAGNQFSAKVFPIFGNTDKHLVISFSQELAGRGYTLPLRGLPKTDRVDVAFTTMAPDGSQTTQSLAHQAWQPDRDFVATVPETAAAVTSGSHVVAAVTLPDARGDLAASEVPSKLTLLVDTSASRALGFRGYVASIRELVAAMRAKYGNALELRVVAFDQDHQSIYSGLATNYGIEQDKALLARGAAGASDLGQAIAALATPGVAHPRVVVVTDGVLTAGSDTPAIVAAIKQLPVQRLDVVLAGGIRDARLASTIVRAGLPRTGDVFDLDAGIPAVAAGLAEPVLTDVAVAVPGATWVYPKTIASARAGSTVMVFAKLEKPAQVLDVVIGNQKRSLGLGRATPALVERAVAGAEIEELETTLVSTTDAGAAKKLREDITARSVRARVISSQTSMLVLETEFDYLRYKIDRRSLSDILVVGPTGLEQTRRTSILATAEPLRLEEGTAGRRETNRSDPGLPSDRAPTDGDARLAREQVLDQARSTGVLGSGASDISSGFDDKNIYGGLLGTETGEMEGGFGFGRSGFGPGGGGSGWGTIGSGNRYGTIGTGSGTGAGYGVGGGRGGMRGRSAAIPTVTIGAAETQGDLDRAIIRRYIKRNIQKIQYCYEKELLARPSIKGTLAVRFVIGETGVPNGLATAGFDATVASCVAAVIAGIDFPRPRSGVVQVTYPFTFRPAGDTTTTTTPLGEFTAFTTPPRTRRVDPPPPPRPAGPNPFDGPYDDEGGKKQGRPALTGKLADVMKALNNGNTDKALGIARAWHAEAPGDVLALIALGESLEASKNTAAAARVYGSIIDLYSTRADFRRFAGERLERLGAPNRDLVVDTYRRAVADRPDHVTGHRLLAYALVRKGDHAGAFAAILAGIDQKYPSGRFAGAERVLKEDAGMIAATYLANGGNRDAVMAELQKRALDLVETPSTRFIMYWETDSNDVDFHIKDSKGGHAYYSQKQLPSGGELYADVTTGYGPECFAIKGTPTAGPYELSINYFSQGPMGYGMGLLQIQKFDGKAMSFEDRPYVIMVDHAFVELGAVKI